MVTPAATALRMSTRVRPFTGEVRSATRDAPWHMSSVSLRVAKTPAALALQRVLWRNVQLHLDSQAAELGGRLHTRHFIVPCHGYYELRGRTEVLGRILVAAPGAKLHYNVDTNFRVSISRTIFSGICLRMFFDQ